MKIFRTPCFLDGELFGSMPTPSPTSKLDQRDIVRLIKGLLLQIEKYLKRRSAANG